MSDLSSPLIRTFAEVFREAGWVVETRQQLVKRELSFDLAAEGTASVAFVKELNVEDLLDQSRRLTAEVAATLQRRSIGTKTWEGYLLLICHGDLTEHERTVQNIQHDLSYCRKLVISGTEIEASADRSTAAQDKIAFLFPLKPQAMQSLGDVRQALARQLVRNGVDSQLAEDLVANFDERTCRCGGRLTAALPRLGGSDQ